MSDATSPNAGRVEKWRARVQGARQKADPQVVADLIVRVLETPRPRLRYVVGTDARMGLLMRSVLPAGVFERLIVKNTGME
jgi:hypothetical protein